MDWIADPTIWLGLATLIALEIVLGIDNLVFIAILADRLPPHQRERARVVGLSLALAMRLALLASIAWVVSLSRPLLDLFGFALTGRDLVLIGGGLFLLTKATMELHERLEGAIAHARGPRMYAGFGATIVQILVLDAVFSLDSVITAVGMVDELAVMMIAVIVAVGVMIAASGPLMRFVGAHPTVIILCLGFLLLVGFSLLLEGFHFEAPKGYLYAAIGFSVLIEAFNQLAQRNRRRALVQQRDLRARTADAVLRLLGAQRTVTPEAREEVASLAAMVGRPGVFDVKETDMIRSVFRLAELPVRAIMTPRREIDWLDANAPTEPLRERIFATGRSYYPVARGTLNNLIGVAHTHELLRDLTERGFIDEATCPDHPLVVHEGLNALHLLEHFRRERVHFAVVVDEYGTVQGIATATDVLEAIAGSLPERGEREPLAERQPDGSWLLDGGLPVERAARLLETELPHSEDYSTLGGFILAELGSLPAPGTVLERAGLCFEVQSLEGRRIGKVRVRALAEAATERR